MAGTKSRTWVAGQQVTAAQMNALEDNIFTTSEQLIGTPRTSAWSMAGQQINLDADADTYVVASTDDRIDVVVGGVQLLQIDGTSASLVNGIVITGDITGVNPTISASGDATGIDVTGLAANTVEISFIANQVFGG